MYYFYRIDGLCQMVSPSRRVSATFIHFSSSPVKGGSVPLNRIIDERKLFERASDNYKKLTKILNKRVNLLRNEKLAKEAD